MCCYSLAVIQPSRFLSVPIGSALCIFAAPLVQSLKQALLGAFALSALCGIKVGNAALKSGDGLVTVFPVTFTSGFGKRGRHKLAALLGVGGEGAVCRHGLGLGCRDDR